MTQQIDPASTPATLGYFAAPSTEIAASETALETLRKCRPWALGCAIGMLVYALVGAAVGTMWLLVLIFGNPGGRLQFAVLIPPNLIGSPLALTGGILAVRYHGAIGRALARRNAEDLERALKFQLYIWRWAGVTVIALFAMPLIIAITTHFVGV